MKVTISAFILAEKEGKWNSEESRFEEVTVYKAWPCDISGTDKVLVCEHDFELDIPNQFDIRDGLIKNLELEKQKAAAEYQKRVIELNAQIQSLLAIEA